MSVELTLEATLKAVETLANNVPAASAANRVLTHDQFDQALSLNANSTPPVTEVAYFVATLTAGALTIDLTSLTSTNGRTLDATGLKLQALLIDNPGNNVINIAPGGSNAYALFGSGNDITIPAGGHLLMFFNDGTPDVASGAKEIDLAGSGTDQFSIGMAFG